MTMDYIRRHYNQPLSLSKLASAAGYSEYYLSRKFSRLCRQPSFREETGLSGLILIFKPNHSDDKSSDNNKKINIIEKILFTTVTLHASCEVGQKIIPSDSQS